MDKRCHPLNQHAKSGALSTSDLYDLPHCPKTSRFNRTVLCDLGDSSQTKIYLNNPIVLNHSYMISGKIPVGFVHVGLLCNSHVGYIEIIAYLMSFVSEKLNVYCARFEMLFELFRDE